MKTPTRLLWSIAALIAWVNFGTSETSVSGGTKNKVNFYGSVTKLDDTTMKVENISIGHLYKEIQLYPMPEQAERKLFTHKRKKDEPDTTIQRYMLDKNPRDGIITRIDLAAISDITVPHNLERWVRPKRHNPKEVIEYLELLVTFNGQEKSQARFLIEDRRKIICDPVTHLQAGTIENEIPFYSIKKLTIEGYKHRDEDPRNVKKTAATQQ